MFRSFLLSTTALTQNAHRASSFLAKRELTFVASGSKYGYRSVQEILDAKRGQLQGKELKQHLREQFQRTTVANTKSVAEAVEQMLKNKVSSLLVVAQNEQSHNVKGIVTDRDYLKFSMVKKDIKDRDQTPVSEIMTPMDKLICVNLDDTELHCMEVMKKHEIRHLPVIKSNKLVGILGFRDFLLNPSQFKKVTLMEQESELLVDDYSFSLIENSDKLKKQLSEEIDNKMKDDK